MMSTHSPDPPSPILRAILNLAAFHRDHEKFYAVAPREQAVVLQRHARTLQALADRWTTTEPVHPTPFTPTVSGSPPRCRPPGTWPWR